MSGLKVVVAGVCKWVPKPIVVVGVLWGRVGMKRTNGAVDEKYLGIRRFKDRINIGLVSLIGCYFNKVHGVTRDGANHNFSYYLWEPCSFDSIQVTYFPTFILVTS